MWENCITHFPKNFIIKWLQHMNIICNSQNQFFVFIYIHNKHFYIKRDR